MLLIGEREESLLSEMSTIDRAQKYKKARATVLAKVASGSLPVREAIWDGHGSLQSCPIHRLLEAAPGLGPQGVRKILERAHVWPLIPLGDLSKLQRRAILNEIPERIK